MRIIRNSVFLIVFTYLLLATSAYAQSNPLVNNASLKTYGCINAVKCNDQDASLHRNVNCPGPNNGSDQGTWPHRARVFNLTPLAPNAQIYVTECIDTSQGLICTTGSSKLDKKLFCGDENATNPICDHYEILRNQAHGYRLFDDWNESDYTVYYSDYRNYSSVAEVKRAQVTTKRTNNQGERNFVTTDANGRLPIIEWQAHTSPETARRYVAYQIVATTPTQTPTPQQQVATPTPIPVGVGGQQQGTLSFATPTPYVAPPSTCDTLTYDPYGRVFDAVTLEPIPDAQLTLLERDPSSGEFSLAFAQSKNLATVNPQSTFMDGSFSFLVEDGDYQLQPSVDGYSFANKSAIQLPTNAVKIYSDLYYADSAVIKQRGAIQHRDIPLQPADAGGRTYGIRIISQNKEAVVANGKQQVRVSGRVSHPFARADVYICTIKNGQETEACNFYKTFEASKGGPDKYGAFSFNLDQTVVADGGRFRVDFAKQDIANIKLGYINIIQKSLSWLQSLVGVGKVQAQEETSAGVSEYVEPIVAYIEGYAYDVEGNILPGARVDIHIPFAELPVYTTYANNTGYYRITSENLPTSSYTISYTSKENNVSQITTSQFLAQNKLFMESEGVDPVGYVTSETNPRRDVSPGFVPEQKISPLFIDGVPAQVTAPSEGEPATTSAKTSRSPVYLVGAIALLLIGGAGVLIALHMYRGKSTEQPDM